MFILLHKKKIQSQGEMRELKYVALVLLEIAAFPAYNKEGIQNQGFNISCYTYANEANEYIISKADTAPR